MSKVAPVQVVGETADIVAVNKPHGMPVHVAGQYRKNTVHGILAAERPDLGELLPVSTKKFNCYCAPQAHEVARQRAKGCGIQRPPPRQLQARQGACGQSVFASCLSV